MIYIPGEGQWLKYASMGKEDCINQSINPTIIYLTMIENLPCPKDCSGKKEYKGEWNASPHCLMFPGSDNYRMG